MEPLAAIALMFVPGAVFAAHWHWRWYRKSPLSRQVVEMRWASDRARLQFDQLRREAVKLQARLDAYAEAQR